MRALLHAELLKLRTTRTFVALSAVAVAVSVLLTALTALLSESEPDDVLNEVFNSDTSGLFILILAIVGISGEWRHRTITSSLLAAPDRLRFIASKTMAFAAAGVVVSLLVAAAVTIVGLSILSARDVATPSGGTLAGLIVVNALLAAFYGAWGVGIGAVVRNQPTAIVGVLLASLAIEPALLGLAPDVGRFGPSIALPLAVQDVPASDLGFSNVDLLAPGVAALSLLAWVGMFFAAGAALLRWRDVD